MILPPVTPKQKEILFLLYKFRFLNTHHVQKMLYHKDPHRIKVWLKDLTDKGYIARNYSRKTLVESTQPAIYYLAPKARHILKHHEKCDLSVLNRVYKEKKRTSTFVKHCLALADLYLFFLSQKKEGEELRFFTESELTTYDYFPKPLPSAYIAVKKANTTQRYFLELFDRYTPSSVIRFRIRRYLSYVGSGEWEAQTSNENLPAILFICPSERIQKHIYFYAKALFEKAFEEKISLYLTTMETIQNNKSDIWQKVNLV